MTSSAVIGVLLIVTGLVDLVLAFVVLGPRLPDKSRRTVQLALVVGAVFLVVLGVLVLGGVLGMGTKPIA